MTTHIASMHNDVTLCGRNIGHDVAWLNKVFQYKKRYKPTFCLICVRIYNTKHLIKGKTL